MAISAALLLVIAYCSLASSRLVNGLRQFSQSRSQGLLLIGLLALPFVLTTLPTAVSAASFISGLIKMLFYLFTPAALLLYWPRPHLSWDLSGFLAIACLWFPLEFNWLPQARVALAPGLFLPVNLLTGVTLGFILFLVIRPLDRIGFTFKWTGRDMHWAALGLMLFLLCAIPLSLALGFVRFGLSPFAPGTWLVRLAVIYFFTALPEELLFRGCLQNLLEQRLGRTWPALAAAALIFGLSHLNNQTAYHLPPNWRYALVASLAGLAYGWIWRKSDKIAVSALAHALVNFTWSIVFLK